jgi:hypothetical protein
MLPIVPRIPRITALTDNNGNSFYGVPYEVNTLGANITATSVTSVRNGKTSTNTTWK